MMKNMFQYGSWNGGILAKASVSVKKHQNHGNSYKVKNLIESSILFQRSIVIMAAYRKTWWGRRNSELYILICSQQKEIATLGLVCAFNTSKLTYTLAPTRTHLLQHLLIVSLPMGQAFKYTSLWRAFLFKPPQVVKYRLQKISEPRSVNGDCAFVSPEPRPK